MASGAEKDELLLAGARGETLALGAELLRRFYRESPGENAGDRPDWRPRTAGETALQGRVAVFFVEDNFALNRKCTKSLLRAIIEAGAQMPWVAQISADLLHDQELVDLIAESGGRWIFTGMESIDNGNLKDEQLTDRNTYAITSFIFGMDNDTVGVADCTLEQIREWSAGQRGRPRLAIVLQPSTEPRGGRVSCFRATRRVRDAPRRPNRFPRHLFSPGEPIPRLLS